MHTLVFLLIIFLITIAGILLYFKSKNKRKDMLNKGECPDCFESTKTFTDPATNTTFKQEVIQTRLLKNHGCSGAVEIEYRCSACGLKEVHTQSSH